MDSNSSSGTFLFSAAVAVLLLTAAGPGYGQVWTDHNEHDPGIVSVEAMIPSFSDLLIAESPSATFELYTRFAVVDNLLLIASLPVSHYETGGMVGGVSSETAIGNPYLGVRVKGGSPGLSYEGGVRLPLSSSGNTGLLTGLLIENHVLGRFLPETTTLTSLIHYHREQASGLVVRAGGGPDLWIPSVGDNELTLTYYGQLLYRLDDLTLGGGLTGLILVSEGDLSYGDRTLNDIGLVGSYRFGGLRAGAYLRAPLDDEVNDFLNYVLGIHLGIVF